MQYKIITVLMVVYFILMTKILNIVPNNVPMIINIKLILIQYNVLRIVLIIGINNKNPIFVLKTIIVIIFNKKNIIYYKMNNNV